MSTALDQLLSLIAAGESLTLELKKSTAEKDRACRSLCALANGQGGYVVFGVTPTGKVVGQKVTDRTLEELAQEFQALSHRCSHTCSVFSGLKRARGGCWFS
ncbi:MAG: ATP-binding protein [Burkholderiales bacterium]|nr:ATP-binding protein [Burkholderiales bacterium]